MEIFTASPAATAAVSLVLDPSIALPLRNTKA
jgi:hypothetical protein